MMRLEIYSIQQPLKRWNQTQFLSTLVVEVIIFLLIILKLMIKERVHARVKKKKSCRVCTEKIRNSLWYIVFISFGMSLLTWRSIFRVKGVKDRMQSYWRMRESVKMQKGINVCLESRSRLYTISLFFVKTCTNIHELFFFFWSNRWPRSSGYRVENGPNRCRWFRCDDTWASTCRSRANQTEKLR